MTITFITGANKGLGRETARRLIELGHTVLLGARDLERGVAVATALGARFVPIDVTDDVSVAAAAANVAEHEGSIDVLVNNAHTHDPARPESKVVVPLYTASKAALTMLTTQYAKAFADIRVNAADPGYTATDLNGHTGPQTVIEGTDAIVRLATEKPGAGSGRFVDRTGEIAWS
jgi:NAD(P)-dependent dehydrogenase (short-subunit alcohol dehydrogenase family)